MTSANPKSRTKRRRSVPEAPAGLKTTIVKVIVLSLLDALSVYAIFALVIADALLVAIVVAAVTIVINWVYFRRGNLPAKYLAPGLLFLAVFQLFVVVYTGYVGFTNYGDGHNSTKEDAVSAIIASARERVADSPEYRLSVIERNGQLGFLVTDPEGETLVGDAQTPLEQVGDAEVDASGKAIAIPGATTLSFAQTIERQKDVVALSVPLTDDVNDGVLRTADGSVAYIFTSSLEYSEQDSTFTNLATGVVYSDDGRGSFASESGQALTPGWKVEVGFDNFARAFGDETVRGPLLSVLVWTFAFAFLTVLTTFALGTFLALVFNAKMRGRKIYRIVMILPYAFPAFLSGLVWAGMLNPQFGFVNEVLLGGANVPWLTDPWLARFSVLFVNLWLGFPYFFLVCTGALQSIPEEVQEAAVVDGASPWGLFRHIKLPLLMVSVAPLLIASFAFNFNNFNVIYMLTGGGPTDIHSSVNAGATDLLITLVYKVAFTGAARDYGLASAFAIIIFVIVGTISIISFRRTKALEDIH